MYARNLVRKNSYIVKMLPSCYNCIIVRPCKSVKNNAHLTVTASFLCFWHLLESIVCSCITNLSVHSSFISDISRDTIKCATLSLIYRYFFPLLLTSLSWRHEVGSCVTDLSVLRSFPSAITSLSWYWVGSCVIIISGINILKRAHEQRKESTALHFLVIGNLPNERTKHNSEEHSDETIAIL